MQVNRDANETSELISNVVHDLKTPISAVMGFIQLVQNLGPLNERQQHFSERALAALRNMEQLVEQLLALSWADAEQPLEAAPCDINMLVRSAATLLQGVAEPRGITLHLELAPGVALVEADAMRMERALLNLVNNAIKYNRDGGDVWISVLNQTESVQVTVRDTGIGIAPEDQPYVFDRFFRSHGSSRTQPKGSGLGLAIVKGIVERHGGSILLASQTGIGTTIQIKLPRMGQVTVSDGERTTRSTGEYQRRQIDSPLGEGHDYVLRQSVNEQPDTVDDDVQERQDTASDADRNEMGAST